MKKCLVGLLFMITLINWHSLKVDALESNLPAINSTQNSDFSTTNTLDIEIVDTSNHIYSYNEMTVDIALLQERYPNYLSFNTVGVSVDNRNIWNVVIGNPSAPKAIYVQASIHGREWMNTWIVMKQIENICLNYNQELFNQICIYIIPMANPDGVTISQYGFEAISDISVRQKLYQMPGAKSPARWKANANGVDLNRNFSVGWGNINKKYTPASTDYKGITPASEPETLAIIKAFTSRKFDIAVTYHSMEGAVYWNIGQSGDIYEKTLTLANQVAGITGYKLGQKSKVNGLEYNWMIFECETPSVIIETGTVICPLPYSQWAEIWKRNANLLLQLAILYQ